MSIICGVVVTPARSDINYKCEDKSPPFPPHTRGKAKPWSAVLSLKKAHLLSPEKPLTHRIGFHYAISI